MSQEIAMTCEQSENLKPEAKNKGVKHLYEIGITKVPQNYILPVVDRPNDSISMKPYDSAHLMLPIIDISQLHGPNHAQLIMSLAHACENYGFFQIINHGVSSDVISKMGDVSRRFFELPLDEREKYMSTNINSLVRYGTSFNQTKDGVFCWRDFLKLVCHPDAYSQWPSDFREIGVAYARETKLLFQLLVEAILESLGLGQEIKEMNTPETDKQSYINLKTEEHDNIIKDMETGSQIMVVNCFPPCPEPELTLGMPPHSDYGFFTLLLQDKVEGLQILFKDRWVTVQPHPHSFVVNVGDHLEIFSNGRFKSVMHRVVVNSVASRISVASLHSVPFITVVRPSPKLINDQNPRLYKDTDFTDFVQYITSCDSKHKNFLESRKIT